MARTDAEQDAAIDLLISQVAAISAALGPALSDIGVIKGDILDLDTQLNGAQTSIAANAASTAKVSDALKKPVQPLKQKLLNKGQTKVDAPTKRVRLPSGKVVTRSVRPRG